MPPSFSTCELDRKALSDGGEWAVLELKVNLEPSKQLLVDTEFVYHKCVAFYVLLVALPVTAKPKDGKNW